MPLRPRRRRLLVVAATTIAVLLVAWVAFAIAVIGHPNVTTQPQQADAIIVLGPSNKRVEQAAQLARTLGIETVALSIGDFPEQNGTCHQPGLKIICFIPFPFTTSGEAAEIGALAEENDWRSVIVIAAKPQAARAEWLVKRCFAGSVQLIAATNSASTPSAWEWVTQSVYQSGAWVKDLLTASCETLPRPTGAPA